MFKLKSKRYSLTQLPKEYYSIRLFHLHVGNDQDGSKRFAYCRKGKKPAQFVTVALIMSRETGVLLAKGVAVCGNRDVPNRATGSTVALGRALKAFIRDYGDLGEALEARPRLRALEGGKS